MGTANETDGSGDAANSARPCPRVRDQTDSADSAADDGRNGAKALAFYGTGHGAELSAIVSDCLRFPRTPQPATDKRRSTQRGLLGADVRRNDRDQRQQRQRPVFDGLTHSNISGIGTGKQRRITGRTGRRNAAPVVVQDLTKLYPTTRRAGVEHKRNTRGTVEEPAPTTGRGGANLYRRSSGKPSGSRAKKTAKFKGAVCFFQTGAAQLGDVAGGFSIFHNLGIFCYETYPLHRCPKATSILFRLPLGRIGKR